MTVFSLGSDESLAIDLDTRGAGIRSLRLRTPAGLIELCLGYPGPVAPDIDPFYVGTLVGRYAGRIAHGRLRRAENHWLLAKAEGERHCLHGGPQGFSSRVWQVKEYTPSGAELGSSRGGSRLLLGLHSPDGDQGFPGALDAEVLFETLGGAAGAPSVGDPPDVGFAYEVRARCDAPTVVNLSSHVYFNLEG
ncbi:MAG: hypothetical protein ACO266_10665, partial [Steroidobacteraceae bacterium]